MDKYVKIRFTDTDYNNLKRVADYLWMTPDEILKRTMLSYLQPDVNLPSSTFKILYTLQKHSHQSPRRFKLNPIKLEILYILLKDLPCLKELLPVVRKKTAKKTTAENLTHYVFFKLPEESLQILKNKGEMSSQVRKEVRRVCRDFLKFVKSKSEAGGTLVDEVFYEGQRLLKALRIEMREYELKERRRFHWLRYNNPANMTLEQMHNRYWYDHYKRHPRQPKKPLLVTTTNQNVIQITPFEISSATVEAVRFANTEDGSICVLLALLIRTESKDFKKSAPQPIASGVTTRRYEILAQKKSFNKNDWKKIVAALSGIGFSWQEIPPDGIKFLPKSSSVTDTRVNNDD